MVTASHRPRALVARPVLCAGLALGLLTACGGGSSSPPDESTQPAAASAPADEAEATTTAASPTDDPVETTSTPPDESAGHGSPAVTESPEEPDALGLEDTDFGNLVWVFRQGGNSADTTQVHLEDGEAEVDLVRYVQGEVVYADINGDGLLDAAAQLTQLDGNGIDDQWYLWIATDEGPHQITLPIARMSRCGNVTKSVESVEGGIQIHEARRGIGDGHLPCSDEGTDERTRTVVAIEARNTGEWWPAQVDPGGFGGLCPVAVEYHGYPYTGALYPAPDGAAEEITGGAEVIEFGLEAWPVYGEDFPGWVLVGVLDGDGENVRCAWAEATS